MSKVRYHVTRKEWRIECSQCLEFYRYVFTTATGTYCRKCVPREERRAA